MKHLLLATGLLAFLSGPGALAQAAQEGLDFDSLSACSIVYGRIGQLYGARGDGAQATSFQETALAYSASAFHSLRYAMEDPGEAYAWAEGRMVTISESLNASSAAHPKQEMGVIEEWLPFCDTLGAEVQTMLDARERDGW